MAREAIFRYWTYGVFVSKSKKTVFENCFLMFFSNLVICAQGTQNRGSAIFFTPFARGDKEHFLIFLSLIILLGRGTFTLNKMYVVEKLPSSRLILSSLSFLSSKCWAWLSSKIFLVCSSTDVKFSATIACYQGVNVFF